MLEAAAWLPDIGYAPGLAVTGLHALDGARYLRDAEHADAASGVCPRMTASRTATGDVGVCPWAEIRPHGFLATTTQ